MISFSDIYSDTKFDILHFRVQNTQVFSCKIKSRIINILNGLNTPSRNLL